MKEALYVIGRKSLLTIALVALVLSIVGPSILRADLIVNGNFEAGNTGFTSGYQYIDINNHGSWTLGPEGTYTVGYNPQHYHSAWTSFGDHTSGSGKMLIANGTTTTGIHVWVGQNAPLSAGTYTFSAWIASVYRDSPARLTFSAGGTELGTFTASGTAGVWQQFSKTFTVGAVSPTFAAVDINTDGWGNDFALDDIQIKQVPDGGVTLMLLGGALVGLETLRRKFRA